MLVLVIVLWIILMSAGQVLFKYAAMYGQAHASSLISQYLLNPFLILAVVLYMLATILWVWILGKMPLKQAYPLNALGFVIVPLLAFFLFKEVLSPSYWIGIGCILVGLLIISLQL